MFMSHQQSAELTKPGVGSLHYPAAHVAPQFASVLVSARVCCSSGKGTMKSMPRFFMRSRSGSESYPRSAIMRLGFCRGRPLRPRDADFGERGFRKCSFTRRGTFEPNSQRKTLTVDQYHPLRTLAALGFTDCGAPFLAGAKLPSRKASSHFSSPSPSSAPSSARQASSQMPSSSHCFRRRQQVAGDGNSSGRKRQAAPVCRIHKMPSKQARFDAHGRPRLSRRRLGGGRRGSTSSHCSSVKSLCRFFMTEAQHSTSLRRKYLR